MVGLDAPLVAKIPGPATYRFGISWLWPKLLTTELPAFVPMNANRPSRAWCVLRYPLARSTTVRHTPARSSISVGADAARASANIPKCGGTLLSCATYRS
jgi:hypothetical protein